MIQPLTGILPILDVGKHVTPDRALEVADALLAGGARALQLRGKALSARDLLALARALRPRTQRHRADLYVNDRPDVALLAEADGVHLGQTDLPAEEVRRWLPARIAIGVSCHNLRDLEAATRSGVAAYCGFGPVFETASKGDPDPVVGLAGLAEAAARFSDCTLVAIGGLTVEQLPAVRRAGAQAAAMISGLLGAPDVEARMREAQAAWDVAEGLG